MVIITLKYAVLVVRNFFFLMWINGNCSFHRQMARFRRRNNGKKDRLWKAFTKMKLKRIPFKIRGRNVIPARNIIPNNVLWNVSRITNASFRAGYKIVSLFPNIKSCICCCLCSQYCDQDFALASMLKVK